MSALELLKQLSAAGHTPTVDGQSLVFANELPERMIPLVTVLQTGIRAILTHRRWYCFTRPQPNPVRSGGEIDPSRLLPANALLLIVDGDSMYDRIHDAWPNEFPELFSKQKFGWPSRQHSPVEGGARCA